MQTKNLNTMKDMYKFIETILQTIKKTSEILEKKSPATLDKIQLNNFLNFFKIKVFANQKSAKAVFDKYLCHPSDPKTEGKTEVWLEVIIGENASLAQELETKISEVQATIRKYEPKTEEKAAEKTAEPKTEMMDDVDELPNTILLLWDFSDISWHSLGHAMKLRTKGFGDITLFGSSKAGKERVKTTKELQQSLKKIKEKYGYTPKATIKEGELTETGTKYADEADFGLIIVPFGGDIKKKDINDFAGCKTPYLFVQDKAYDREMDNVVLPVDERVEIRRKVNIPETLLRKMDIEYVICHISDFANDTIKNKIIQNARFIESYFRQKKIRHTTREIKNTSCMDKAALQCAKDIQAEMILIVPENDLTIRGYGLDSDSRDIITNSEGIPVMCFNPVKKSGSFGRGVMY